MKIGQSLAFSSTIMMCLRNVCRLEIVEKDIASQFTIINRKNNNKVLRIFIRYSCIYKDFCQFKERLLLTNVHSYRKGRNQILLSGEDKYNIHFEQLKISKYGLIFERIRLLLGGIRLFTWRSPSTSSFFLEEVVKKITSNRLIISKKELNSSRKKDKLFKYLGRVLLLKFCRSIAASRKIQIEELILFIASRMRNKEREKPTKYDRDLRKYIKAIILGCSLLQAMELQVSAEGESGLGEVFPIIEEDLSEVISQKLKDLEQRRELESH